MSLWHRLVDRFRGDEGVDWEPLLLEADLGVKLAGEWMEELRESGLARSPEKAEAWLREKLEKLVRVPPPLPIRHAARSHPPRRGERQRQNDHGGEARGPRAAGGTRGAARRGRHLPRRGGGAAGSLGRAAGHPGDQRRAGDRPGQRGGPRPSRRAGKRPARHRHGGPPGEQAQPPARAREDQAQPAKKRRRARPTTPGWWPTA